MTVRSVRQSQGDCEGKTGRQVWGQAAKLGQVWRRRCKFSLLSHSNRKTMRTLLCSQWDFLYWGCFYVEVNTARFSLRLPGLVTRTPLKFSFQQICTISIIHREETGVYQELCWDCNRTGLTFNISKKLFAFHSWFVGNDKSEYLSRVKLRGATLNMNTARTRKTFFLFKLNTSIFNCYKGLESFQRWEHQSLSDFNCHWNFSIKQADH